VAQERVVALAKELTASTSSPTFPSLAPMDPAPSAAEPSGVEMAVDVDGGFHSI
jgi:hypothetical protein